MKEARKPGDARLPAFLDVARRREVVVRAAGYMVVVGTVLMLINHADALMMGNVGAARVAKILLTYLVPYTVSTCSSVQAVRDTIKAEIAAELSASGGAVEMGGAGTGLASDLECGGDLKVYS